MITELQLSGFKAWRDTGPMRMAPLTVLFGANSAGKSSIIDFLRILQRTVLSADRAPLTLLPDQSLGEIVHGAEQSGDLAFRVCWRREAAVADAVVGDDGVVCLSAKLVISGGSAQVGEFAYRLWQDGAQVTVGMEATSEPSSPYRLLSDGLKLMARERRDIQNLPPPTKCYIFPTEAFYIYDHLDAHAGLPLSFERTMRDVTYLGPVRADPKDVHGGANEVRSTVGDRGEGAVAAAAAAGTAVEGRLAAQLKAMGLVDGFRLERLDSTGQTVRVWVRTSPNGPEVGLKDVGFGVSQVLPVLVQCLIVPEHSIVILSHPEAHLHPIAQAELADALIDAIRERGLQIILESHSEYLLHRLQRRIAEQQLPSTDAAMYFSSFTDDGEARLEELELDAYGNIANWPTDFFGDVMGDLVAMAEAGSGGAVED